MAASGDQDVVASGGAFHPVAEVVAELVGADEYFGVGLSSGASGTRTHDLSAASRTLSQLSYSPESVLTCKVNAGALAISWWIQSQMDLPLAGDDFDRDQEHFTQRGAVHGHRVDLLGRVGTRHIAVRGKPRSADAHADHAQLPVEGAPFALRAKQPSPDVQSEVIAAVLGKGLQDVDPKLDRLQRDRCLGDVAFLIRGEHPPILA
jgi:hypothetical protein